MLIKSFTFHKLGAELESGCRKTLMFLLGTGTGAGLANTDCLHGSSHLPSTIDHNNLLYQTEIARAQKHNALYCCVISVSWRWSWNLYLVKENCFLECCSSVEMSSQNINVWRPNPRLTKFVGSYSAEFYTAEFSYTCFHKWGKLSCFLFFTPYFLPLLSIVHIYFI